MTIQKAAQRLLVSLGLFFPSVCYAMNGEVNHERVSADVGLHEAVHSHAYTTAESQRDLTEQVEQSNLRISAIVLFQPYCTRNHMGSGSWNGRRFQTKRLASDACKQHKRMYEGHSCGIRRID